MDGHAGELHVDVVPWGPAPEAVRDAARATLEHPAVRSELGDADYRLLSAVPVPVEGAPADAPAQDRIVATVYDYTNERALEIQAPIDGSAHVDLTSTARQPFVSNAEFESAVEAVRADPELGANLRDGGLTPYKPMPPLVLDEQPDGRVERVVTVGLRRPDSPGGHEIVGVRAADGKITRFEGGAPRPAIARDDVCGLPNAGQPTADRGDAGAVRVTVSRGGEILWRFVAVRPAASSGT